MRNLFDAVAQIESATYFRAERFEPLTLAKIQNNPTDAINNIIDLIKAVHRCSRHTAEVIYSTSYGAVQIMGANLWGPLRCQMHKVDFVTNEAVQTIMFDRYCEQRGINFTLDQMRDPEQGHARRQLFALRYNGPGAVDDYSDRLAKVIGA